MRDLIRILASAKKLWRYYVVIGVCTILLALMNLLQPLLSGWAIDALHGGNHARVAYVVWLAVGIFGLDIAANLFSNIGGYYGDQLSLKLNRFLGRNYYQHLLELSQEYFDTELTGKIINRLNRSINQISNFVQVVSNNFLQFIFTTIFTLIIVAHYSWQVAVLLFSIYPVYIYLTTRTSGPWQSWQKEKNLHLDIASGRFAEVVGQIKVVRSFLREQHELKIFKHEYDQALTVNRPQSAFWHRQDIIRRFVLAVLFLVIYIVIFVQAVHGTISPGVAVALILYSMQIRIPIFSISFLVDSAQRAIADSRDYFAIMDQRPAITDKRGAQELVVTKGEVELQDVVFQYSADKPVLRSVTFHAKPKSTLALVGESGEGKTTITNLLLRLYEPESGTITIDGQNIATVTQASLRKNIGMVFQEPALFSGTIRENITYGRPDADESALISAAKAANADTFIGELPKGYDTEIGERGLKLSGGQKQRLAIARALLKDAPILLLDEATSSLDGRSEKTVQEALQRLMKNRTTIIIAHRLSTIEHVDQIVTLSGGRVDEIGSPAELAQTEGIYAQLLALQQHHSAVGERKLKKFGIQS